MIILAQNLGHRNFFVDVQFCFDAVECRTPSTDLLYEMFQIYVFALFRNEPTPDWTRRCWTRCAWSILALHYILKLSLLVNLVNEEIR